MLPRLKHLLPAFLYYGFIFFLSAQPNVKLPVAFPLIDKILHFILYAGFGVCLAYGLIKTIRRGKPGLVGFVLGPILAGLDEFHQLFVPGRSADVLDGLVDVLGLTVGIWVFRRIVRSRPVRRAFNPARTEEKGPQP